jgi:hypothetical protein
MVTFVGLLNALLSILFPLWPWEPFFVMPFVLEFFKCKGQIGNCILFVTAFGAVFCLAHGAGALQAVDTFFYGGPGICVPALPGAPNDIDTGAMCKMMAIHIFMMLAMGLFFTTIVLNSARRVPAGNLEAVYYSRAALFFIVGGVSQDIPYWAVCLQYPERFWEFMSAKGVCAARMRWPRRQRRGDRWLRWRRRRALTARRARLPGFYSNRGITPGFTEFFAPIIWIVYGLFSYGKLMSLVDGKGGSAMY